MICWTLGITEHHNAVDNVLALINLVLLTGHVGRYGSGVNPLRGQNNVQGGGDMGALPEPAAGLPARRERRAPGEVRRGLGRDRPAAAAAGTCRRCSTRWSAASSRRSTCIGENPLQSEADQKRAKHLLETRDFIVVQDIFLTATAELADVVLPAAAAWAESEGTVTNSERRVQRVRKALDPPGEARDDLWIIYELARRMGHDWGSPSAEDVWNEVRSLSPVHAGMSYQRLEELGGIQWPCYDENHPGELFLHSRLWEDPVPGNRVPFVAVDHDPPVDKLDDDFPIRLTTGRRLDSYNTGVQTGGYTSPLRRGESLDISPGGRRAARPRRRRARPRRLAPRPGRGADPDRRVAPARADVHDAPLPGRRRDEPPDDRRDRPEVRHGRVQGDRDPDREAGNRWPASETYQDPRSTHDAHALDRHGTGGRHAMKRVITTRDAPTGNAAGPFPFSQAVVAGGLVFVAGQGPLDPATGAIVGDTIQEQTRQALRNVEAILDAAGSSMDRIVNVLFLLANPEDFAGLNEEWARWFPTTRRPAAVPSSRWPSRTSGSRCRSSPRPAPPDERPGPASSG